MEPLILALDIAGSPSEWLSVHDAANLYATNKIAWAVGTHEFVLRGGTQQATGLRSQIRVSSIVAVASKDFRVHRHEFAPGLTREMLFQRDRHTCAYCGGKFREKDLNQDHILPQSRGGRYTWMNMVTACKPCNNRKAARTPDEARMPLLYVPYRPNRHETFILRGRRILKDQMEFLLAQVPEHSRLKAA